MRRMLAASVSRRQTARFRSLVMRLIPLAVIVASLAACGPHLSVVVPPAENICATLRGDPGITARLKGKNGISFHRTRAEDSYWVWSSVWGC